MSTSGSPKLSRIVTCYKQWQLLQHWLSQDALFQAGVEWIIINDSPLDPPPPNLQDLCHKRGILVITPRFNIGRSNARNAGAEAATGEWLDFIDGDDFPYVLPLEALDGLQSTIAACPVVGFSDPSALLCDSPPTVELPWSSEAWMQNELFFSYMPIDYRPCGMLFHRDAFKKIGGFDARFDDAWQDANIVWKAYQYELPLERLSCVKQGYMLGEYDGKPARVTGVSVYNLFRLYEAYGEAKHRNKFQHCQHDSLRIALWQILTILNNEGELGWRYRLKLIAKLLLKFRK